MVFENIFFIISGKDSWLLNGVFDYYITTGSDRGLMVLLNVRENHANHLFDRYDANLLHFF